MTASQSLHSPSPHLQRIDQFCAEHFLDNISARDVYAACDLKPTYGAILFRRHRGRTLTQHLTALRVEHALSLLHQNSTSPAPASVCDIAFASGFRSLSRFYEAFTAHTGQSPRAISLSPPALIPPDPIPSLIPKEIRLRAIWVDDHPQSITEERQLLAQSLGIHTDVFTTNTAALAALRSSSYDLVLSDVRRVGSHETGWELAAELLHQASSIPLHFYTGFISAERRKLAHKLDAASISTRSRDLFAAISKNLPSTPSK